MTDKRAMEIERLVIYKYIEDIMIALEDCEDTHVIFNVGRILGKMQDTLNDELSKEVERSSHDEY